MLLFQTLYQRTVTIKGHESIPTLSPPVVLSKNEIKTIKTTYSVGIIEFNCIMALRDPA